MRYVMKKKIFAISDKFAIQNENGEDAFFVHGKVFAIGHKLSFEDPQGNELLFIRQKMLSFGPTYELYHLGQHVATIKKEIFTFFRAAFDIHVAGQPDLHAQGNLSDHEYTVTRDGRPIAQISKQWFSIRDTYGVELADGEDAVLILASTVVIDMCCHEQKHTDVQA
jgi:uncharacterized protein YxjI